MKRINKNFVLDMDGIVLSFFPFFFFFFLCSFKSNFRLRYQPVNASEQEQKNEKKILMKTLQIEGMETEHSLLFRQSIVRWLKRPSRQYPDKITISQSSNCVSFGVSAQETDRASEQELINNSFSLQLCNFSSKTYRTQISKSCLVLDRYLADWLTD